MVTASPFTLKLDFAIIAAFPPDAAKDASNTRRDMSAKAKKMTNDAPDIRLTSDKVNENPVYVAQEEMVSSPLIPTGEELSTLRRMPDDFTLNAFTIGLIELCERFTYYGTGQLRKVP